MIGIQGRDGDFRLMASRAPWVGTTATSDLGSLAAADAASMSLYGYDEYYLDYYIVWSNYSAHGQSRLQTGFESGGWLRFEPRPTLA